jgi:hypothetical protein
MDAQGKSIGNVKHDCRPACLCGICHTTVKHHHPYPHNDHNRFNFLSNKIGLYIFLAFATLSAHCAISVFAFGLDMILHASSVS